MQSKYDVLIIGGSHAGLSAAMALGRIKRSALIVDDNNARNSIAAHANNIAGLDGMNPNVIRNNARKDLMKYETLDFVNGSVVAISKTQSGFIAQLQNSRRISFRKVILSFGIKDKLPEIKGFKELWGTAIFHCPYCHGYEIQNQKIGFLGSRQMAEHMIPMLHGLTQKIHIFANHEDSYSEAFASKLMSHDIKTTHSPISHLEHLNTQLHGVVLENGQKIALNALFFAGPFPIQLKSDLADQLSCERDEAGLIKTDPMGMTNIEGVFAAGDIASFQHSVIGAMATGQTAGSSAAFQLLKEDF